MYEIGVGVAFICWAISMGGLLVAINSQMERNLNKVGFRHSWITHTPKPMGNNHRQRRFLSLALKFLLIATVGLISILFSWLYVAAVVGNFIYGRSKDSGAPQEVKEFRWRMKNMNLSFDQVVEGMALISGDTTSTDRLKQELQAEMVNRGNA